MINKSQYIRLSIVLMVPFAILSWWLSQQDSILERGKSISCDVQGNYCESVHSFPVSAYTDFKKNSLTYDLHDGESIIYLRNFSYQIGPAYYVDINTQEKIIAPSADIHMTATRLEQEGCSISFYYYFCKGTNGEFNFVDENNAKKFEQLIISAKNELKNSEKIRLSLAIAIFFGIVLSYILFSGVIRFIIYGFKK